MADRGKIKWGRVVIRAALLFAVVFGGVLGAAMIWHPESRFPNHWNPVTPLAVSDPVTPLTGWKLRRATGNPAQCRAVLDSAAQVLAVDDVTSDNPNCGIPQAVTLAGVGGASISVQTSCASALRTAMWNRHGLQPAAALYLDTSVTRLLDQGSYNCRQMRTTSGASTRYSTHSTGDAIDIRGFVLADGTRLTLVQDWGDSGAKAEFLRAARDSACIWFRTVLGPDYNRLHADHFHLQATGWGTCR